MTPMAHCSWSFPSFEFKCRGCGAHEAFRSRPRGFFEAFVLPFFSFQAVRCDRCYLRSYVPRVIPCRERIQPESRPPASEPGTPHQNSRVA
jgi:hypothetical protein